MIMDLIFLFRFSPFLFTHDPKTVHFLSNSLSSARDGCAATTRVHYSSIAPFHFNLPSLDSEDSVYNSSLLRPSISTSSAATGDG